MLGLTQFRGEYTVGLWHLTPDASKLAPEAPGSNVAVAEANPTQLLRNAKTVYLQSKASFLTIDSLDRALRPQKAWEKLGLTLVQDPRVADVSIQIDRPLFIYVHTFLIADKRTSIVWAQEIAILKLTCLGHLASPRSSIQ